jgi:hypothetical protein
MQSRGQGLSWQPWLQTFFMQLKLSCWKLPNAWWTSPLPWPRAAWDCQSPPSVLSHDCSLRGFGAAFHLPLLYSPRSVRVK